MRLYTVQRPVAWDEAQVRGYLTGAEGAHLEEYWHRPYGWMRSQMARRLAAFSGDNPVWAWVKRPDFM